MSNKQKTIERIEKDLLIALLDYIVPFLDKKIKPAPKRDAKSGLENIVLNTKPKIAVSDFEQIEDMLSRITDTSTAKKTTAKDSKNVLYALIATRKSTLPKRNYSIKIEYSENGKEEKLKIRIEKGGQEMYAAETAIKKDAEDNVAPYKFVIFYEDRYGEERLAITYRQQLRNYMKKHAEDREDMSNRVPLKWLNILPETLMGGVLGFTYIGDPAMGRRADLTGKTARMVDIHESIHTPDEYETVCLTQWIMSKERSKYRK